MTERSHAQILGELQRLRRAYQDAREAYRCLIPYAPDREVVDAAGVVNNARRKLDAALDLLAAMPDIAAQPAAPDDGGEK